jgi:O-antigen ligase
MGPTRLGAAAVVFAVVAGWSVAGHGLIMPLLFLGLLLVVLAMPPRERRLVDERWVFVGLAVLGGSFLVAYNHELAVRHTLSLVAAVSLFALARRSPPSAAQLSGLAAALGLTGVVAIVQGAGGLQRAQLLVGELPSAWQEAASARLATGRVFGTAALPGHFAALMLMCLPLLATALWRSCGWRRLVWGTVLLVDLGAVALTRSLGALLLGGVLLILLLRGKAGTRSIVTAAIGLAGIAVVVLAFRHDLRMLEPLRLRWINWRTTAWVFAQHPWLGVGLGGVGQAALLAPTAAANITPYTHNTYLELLAEFGLGGAGFLLFGVLALRRLLSRGWGAEPALVAAVAIVPLHNLADFSAYAPEVLLPWAVLAGALAGRLLPPAVRPLHTATIVAVLGGAAVLATFAWRSEVELDRLSSASPRAAVGVGLSAAAWAPWTVTPLELCSARALSSGGAVPGLDRLDTALATRGWVLPASAGWAEVRARLALATGRTGEAVMWAREAHRRAPWRADVAELEAECGARR